MRSYHFSSQAGFPAGTVRPSDRKERKEYPSGAVRTAEQDSDGNWVVVWDYTNDRHAVEAGLV